jgi:ribose transport system ATP-binding protein
MSTAECTSTDTPPASLPVLSVRGVVKDFGATRALDGVELNVYPGEIHALLGANGAGKSTLLGVIGGSVAPDAGEIVLRSDATDADATVAIVHQELSLLPDLSVAENVCPEEALFGSHGVSRQRAARRRSAAALQQLGSGLVNHLDTPVGRLPLDERELVEIARGLCSGSRIILLDEPTSPLNDAQVDHLFTTLRAMTNSGVAVVIVSHRLSEVRRVAEVATVIRDGRTVLDRHRLADVSNDELAEQMIGRSVERTLASYRSTSPKSEGRPLLRIHHSPSNQSVDVRAGEIVGVAALTPDDARHLVRCAWGAAHHRDLEVSPRCSPRQAARAGAAYISGDRKQDALFAELDLRENVMTPQRVVRRRPWLSRELPVAEAALSNFNVKAGSVFDLPDQLSGGNQQKMIFASWLTLGVRLLLLDDPTRGVDVGAKNEIYKRVRAVVSNGGGALWSSSDTEELSQVCDRVVVVRGTEPIAELSGDEISEASIVTTMNHGGRDE